jgi:hypothetical protein
MDADCFVLAVGGCERVAGGASGFGGWYCGV